MKINFFTKTKRIEIRGFTLIEALVSAFVITSVVLGPLTVALDATSYARLTKDTMTSTYLAEEAVELLRQRQDTIYIHCTQENDLSCPLENNETPSEAAWRIFKQSISYTNEGISCYSTDNRSGCAYDFLSSTENLDQPLVKYLSTETYCNTLALRDSDSLYVCGGVHTSTYNPAREQRFSRTVQIESLQTFNGGDGDYNDDLRITSTVTFRRPSGFSRSIQFVDFLHSRS